MKSLDQIIKDNINGIRKGFNMEFIPAKIGDYNISIRLVNRSYHNYDDDSIDSSLIQSIFINSKHITEIKSCMVRGYKLEYMCTDALDYVTSNISDLAGGKDLKEYPYDMPQVTKESVVQKVPDAESVETEKMEKVEPVSLYDFFLTDDCWITTEKEYLVDIGVIRFSKNFVATFNTEFYSISRKVDIYEYLEQIQIGLTSKKSSYIQGIKVFYNDESELQLIKNHIKELQPKAEKLTRKELVILDRLFAANYKLHKKKFRAFNWAMSLCVPDLFKEVKQIKYNGDLNPLVDFILDNPDDRPVLKNINKAIDND